MAPLLSEVQKSQGQLQTQVKDLALAVEQKGCGDMGAKMKALDVAQKESMNKLDDIMSQMDLKGKADEVSSTEAPSSDQYETWLSEAEQKCREHVAAVLAPLEERQATIQKSLRSHGEKIAAFRALDSELECKANLRDVPTLKQFEKLEATLKKMAMASKVPTLTQFAELQELVESKASTSLVPSMSELREIRIAVEKKADASSVPAAADLQKLVEKALEQKANVEDVEKALEQKANSDQMQPLTSNVENLASVMERKLAFLAGRLQKTTESVDNLLSQAMVCYVPSTPQCGTWQQMGNDPNGRGQVWAMPGAETNGMVPGVWVDPIQGLPLQAAEMNGMVQTIPEEESNCIAQNA